jgi:hypothetical protein
MTNTSYTTQLEGRESTFTIITRQASNTPAEDLLSYLAGREKHLIRLHRYLDSAEEGTDRFNELKRLDIPTLKREISIIKSELASR